MNQTRDPTNLPRRLVVFVALLISSLSLFSFAFAATFPSQETASQRASSQKTNGDYVFENQIPVLGVIESERTRGPAAAALLSLELKIRQGSGRIYIALDAMHQIDTQAGLRLAHETTCAHLDLPCDQYDFYYAFDINRRTLVGGQSSSAAAGYLLAKTLNFETVDPEIVVTGRLAPGAIVALADGIEPKIELAQSLGFKKIYIPANALCSKNTDCDAPITSGDIQGGIPENIEVIRTIGLEELLVNAPREITETRAGVTEQVDPLEPWKTLYAQQQIKSALTTACQHINRRIQFTVLSLNRFRAAHFAPNVTEQMSLPNNLNDSAICLYKGIELEAELSVTLNFLDMKGKTKKIYLRNFLAFTRMRISTVNTSQKLLASYHYNLASEAYEAGDLDSAYLIANKAIGFTSSRLF
ncbi:MAG: hypothetical protein ACJAVI_004471 [Candidatus Azotimanducaceae bacterium]